MVTGVNIPAMEVPDVRTGASSTPGRWANDPGRAARRVRTTRTVRLAAIATYGETRQPRSSTAPATRAPTCPATSPPVSRVSWREGTPGGSSINHCVGNVILPMDEWRSSQRARLHEHGRVHRRRHRKPDYSALMSKVVASGNHRVKFPLNEPARSEGEVGIDEYPILRGVPVASIAPPAMNTSCAASTSCDNGYR